MNIRDNAIQIWDAWRATGCRGTWANYLADALQKQPIHVVTVSGQPERAFREAHKAEHYIDHHDTPNLCEIHEVILTE